MKTNGTWVVFTFLLSIISLSAQDFEIDEYIEGGLNSFAQADFNKDGKPDLIGLNYKFVGATDIVVLLNVSDSIIKFETITLASSEVLRGSPAVGDLDGDDDVDIAVALELSNSILILRNNGDNTFTQEDQFISGANQLEFHDLEGDGDLDIIGYILNDNTISTFINDGSGSFSLGPLTQHVNDISFVDYGDIDNDGDIDLALSVDKFSGETIAIYLNDSLNNFTKLSSFDINALNSAVQVKMVDINNDGKLDVLGLNDKRLTAFIQNDVFGFVARDLVDPNNSGDLSYFEIADFDGDGFLDALIGDHTADMRWYRNQGLIFTQHEVSSVQPIYNLFAADFDEDGDVDFVADNGDFRAFRNEIGQMPSSSKLLDLTDISIFPNPAGEFLYVDQNEGEGNITIYHMSGAKVYECTLKSGLNKLDVSTLNKGFYFLSLQNSKNQILTQKKFIKL